ncbi:transcriptional regulator [Klebsiella pneumoniae]|uniref:transcriptional regulator n=1 Tax=Klebsiella pneumoniae TaxID=573 RepID=UPI0027BA27F2|nr:YdaS family helix-turn-helix protein [Klebsiella pneumoniae]WLY35707.1 YdaS family helix-turn-helix protein [Klebsiella pneumoniae]
MSETVNDAIKRAIGIAGSQTELARKTGVNQSTISKWLNGAEISSRFIKSIVVATDGKVSADEILNSISHR